MRRRIQGLHEADQSAASQVRDGLLLVRIERAQHRRESRKPFYLFRFSILEPKELTGHSVVRILLAAGRCNCPIPRMVALPKAKLALLEGRHVGPDASTRNSAVRPILPG